MESIRTLLLARTHTVVLDPDRVASAATRPARDVDVDRFEDELLQLGFVLSLDLAMTLRRLPHEAGVQLRAWIADTLGATLGAHRPHVPLFRGFPAATPGDTQALYLRRVLSWLLTRADQPCPWCGQVKTVAALDPCGHLVCRACWDGGTYSGCPICHRRVSPTDPFVELGALGDRSEVTHHGGELRLVHLALDLVGVAKARFERTLARATPLSKDDRTEVETVIDTIGPMAAMWLPARIPVKETMAIAVARLWLVAPDRAAMAKATQGHLRTATDVLRVAAVLMQADPALVDRHSASPFGDAARLGRAEACEPRHSASPFGDAARLGRAEACEPMQLRSIPRALRRAILESLDRLPAVALLEDVMRHVGLWKRVGERLHPFEFAARYPKATLAFAAVRETDVANATFRAELTATAANVARVRIADNRVEVTPWAGLVEAALRGGEVRLAAQRLGERPGELLRRADHLIRVTSASQPEALADVLGAIRTAVTRGAPAMLLTLASHVAKRAQPWSRRVVFPKGEVLRAWAMRDTRTPLPADAIGAITTAVRAELVARAEARRQYPRAVIDRGLADLLVPIGERSASRSRISWPRGSEIAMPAHETLRLFLHWEEPPRTRVDLDLSVAFYDGDWRHVATCDFTNLVVGGDRAAVHSGDLTSAPPPLGASEFVDLRVDALIAQRARYAVMVVFSFNAVSFDRLTHGFAGLMAAPANGEAFDPRAVVQRFDLGGRSVITVPLTIDLATRRLRWLDVHVKDYGSLHQVGGYRAALAHIGRDFADFVGTGARPTLWEVAAIHAAARANTAYVRDARGIAIYRRRDNETSVQRLARILSGEHDGTRPAIPPANAPTWLAVLRDDLAISPGSAGYILDARTTGGDAVTRLSASDLVAELAPISR